MTFSFHGSTGFLRHVFLVFFSLHASVTVGLDQSTDPSIRLQQPSPRLLLDSAGSNPTSLPDLRFDWSAGRAISPLAKRIEENQRCC